MTPAQTDTAPTQGHAASQVLSVDAMGGDKGPATVVAGLSKFLKDKPDARAILHGPKAEMEPGQWQQMREFLAPQYDAMSEMLGSLPPSWGKEPARV